VRRVSVRVPRSQAETARARLLALAPSGIEEVDRTGEVELAVYTDDAGEAAIRSAFAHVAASAVEPGWEERWRSFHRPVDAGGLWIGPPWEPAPAGKVAVVIDPGRAFGTGAHPTTRACVELLAAEARGSLLDAGSGSGVVAVAAARLGFSPVLAVDADPAAVEVTGANAERNGVLVDARRLDVLADALPRTDLVVANIELSVVELLLSRRPARKAITSGYLGNEAPRVRGWQAVTRLEIDGWAADALVAE
jgi:ribosomal protein L11 methyltransferase